MNNSGLIKHIFCLVVGVIIIRKYKIDIIHTNASNVSLGAEWARMLKIPHVWHIREMLKEDYDLTYFFPQYTAKLIKKTDTCIAISNYIAEKRKIPNCEVIYNGICIHDYILTKSKYYTCNTITLLYAGYISEQKGIFDAVKAIEYFVNNGIDNVRLLIAGDENYYWQNVVFPYIKSKEIDAYITFCGYQIDLSQLRIKSDIALMCSKSEGLGRVTIESMLGEVLVIGANCGATKELIRDEFTGLLYEWGDYIDLAHKILYAYNNPEKTIEITKNAKTFAIDTFDSRRYAKVIMNLYMNIT